MIGQTKDKATEVQRKGEARRKGIEIFEAHVQIISVCTEGVSKLINRIFLVLKTWEVSFP